MSFDVNFKGPKLGKVPILKCVDYSVCDPIQFLELKFDKYACIFSKAYGIENVVIKKWVKPLRKFDILTFLNCPHFGQAPIVYACVCFLLTRLHYGYLWMDKPYPIKNNKMQWVSSLPTSREDLVITINEKDAKQEDIYTQFETC